MRKLPFDDPEMAKELLAELQNASAFRDSADDDADGDDTSEVLARLLRQAARLVQGAMVRLSAEELAEMERHEQMQREFQRRDAEMRAFYRTHPEEKAKVLKERGVREAFFIAEEPERAVRSKLGGTAELPGGMARPVNPRGEALDLLAQIDCSELPRPSPMPARGVLYFFLDLASDVTGYAPWDGAYYRVVYSVEPPGRRCGDGVRVVFRAAPSYGFGEYRPGIDEGEWMLTPHWLSGFSGWDEREVLEAAGLEKEEWRLLLSLGSDGEWLWSDCGSCLWFIRENDLARCDFSDVRMFIASS